MSKIVLFTAGIQLLVSLTTPVFAASTKSYVFAGPALEAFSNHRLNNTKKNYDMAIIYRPTPLILLDLWNFSVTDKGLQYNFHQSQAYALYLVGNIHGDDYESEGMASRERSVFAGLGVRYYVFSLFGLKDALNKSHGSLWRAQLQYPFRPKNWLILPTLGATSYDKSYVDYYYGVTTAEANALRSEYQGLTAFDHFASLRIFYFWKNWASYLLIENRLYSEEISLSPTVNTATVNTAILGLAYKFH